MLIPRLHFCGNCLEAISVYEKAFNTKTDRIERLDNEKIIHASMNIHGQTVFLNDRFGNKNRSVDCAVHLIIKFKNKEELLTCYEALKDGSEIIDPFIKTPYSELVGNFMDKFGVLWGFMAE